MKCRLPIANLRRVSSQRSKDLARTAAEAWNLAEVKIRETPWVWTYMREFRESRPKAGLTLHAVRDIMNVKSAFAKSVYCTEQYAVCGLVMLCPPRNALQNKGFNITT
jgi:hypothetical protein